MFVPEALYGSVVVEDAGVANLQGNVRKTVSITQKAKVLQLAEGGGRHPANNFLTIFVRWKGVLEWGLIFHRVPNQHERPWTGHQNSVNTLLKGVRDTQCQQHASTQSIPPLPPSPPPPPPSSPTHPPRGGPWAGQQKGREESSSFLPFFSTRPLLRRFALAPQSVPGSPRMALSMVN